MVKLHIGCGTVYLRDYKNIDLRESGALLASADPSLATARAVSENDYYGQNPNRTIDDFAGGTDAEENIRICDAYGSFENIPCDDGQADEILSRQVFEHLSAWEAQRALRECRRVLKTGGLLRLSVPDVPQTIELWKTAVLTGDVVTETFCGRHVFGSKKSDAFHHLCAWDSERLRVACYNYGFELLDEEPNIHAYPATCLKFAKLEHCDYDRAQKIIPLHKAAWEYCGDPRGTPLVVPKEWKCLEVGPGRNPWPRADFYVDAEPAFLRGLPRDKTLACDVQNLSDHLKLPNGEKYDFVFIAHVMEHVQEPQAAVLSLSRVAKRGVIVCPSEHKEGMFNLGEADHRWAVSPPWRHDKLYFQSIDQGWRNAVHNPDTEKQTHQLYRLGAERFGESGEQAREWYYNAEANFDCIHRWEGCPNIEVLR